MNGNALRRTGGWLLLAGALLIPLAPGAQEGRSLTFVSWGGAYTKSQILAFVRPYEAEHETTIEVLDYNGGLGRIRDQVRSLNFKWDVVDLELTDAIRGCEEGLLEPIDAAILAPAPDGTEPKRDFIPGTLTECAVGTVMWSTVIAYDAGSFDAAAPSGLEDYFDTERFPGGRGMRRTPKANLEWALMADGVGPEQVYSVLETEQGLRRAFAVLERIKPQLVWWEEGEQAVRLLETGRVVMTTAYNGRIYEAAVGRGEPFEILWDRQIWNIDLLGIPRGHPEREAALAFIRYATATERLAEQARHIAYGPVRRSSLQQVPAAVVPHLPTAPDHLRRALRIDARWWAAHFEPINRRFQEWAERPVGVPRALPR